MILAKRRGEERRGEAREGKGKGRYKWLDWRRARYWIRVECVVGVRYRSTNQLFLAALFCSGLVWSGLLGWVGLKSLVIHR